MLIVKIIVKDRTTDLRVGILVDGVRADRRFNLLHFLHIQRGVDTLVVILYKKNPLISLFFLFNIVFIFFFPSQSFLLINKNQLYNSICQSVQLVWLLEFILVIILVIINIFYKYFALLSNILNYKYFA